MRLVATGLSQHTAPLSIRARLSISAAELPYALGQMHEVAAAGFILATCNRSEIYALLPDRSVAALHHFLATRSGLTDEELNPYLYTYSDAAAVSHLLRVSAGLDSMVLGEEQILAQIKAALAAARRQGLLGGGLQRLGQVALACGKQVRTHTMVSRRPLSVVSIALDLAASHEGYTAARQVLIVGAGHSAELALKHLGKAKPDGNYIVVNRTAAHASALAARYHAAALPLSELMAALADCDFAICCTASPTPLIDAALMRRVMAVRQRPILLLDLAVPPDVDPEVAQLAGVTLYDMDSLAAICAANRDYRQQEVATAEAIVVEHTCAFMEWQQGRQAVPTIAALRAAAEAIRDTEVTRTLTRLPHLSEHERAIIERMAQQIVNKMLHQPITALKSAQLAGRAQLVRQLFALDAPATTQGEPISLSTGAEDVNYQ